MKSKYKNIKALLSIICILCLWKELFIISIASNESTEDEASISEQEFVYTFDGFGNYKVSGFWFENNYYSFIYDERDIITEICDDVDTPVALYECDDKGTITDVLSWTSYGWQSNHEINFIGNINKMRWLGYIYDESSECYLIEDRYYDPKQGRFLDGTNDTSVLSNSNPFVSANKNDIMPLDSYYNDLAAQEWADALLATSTYGVAKSYSSNWYTSLSDVEVLARCIYCEGGTSYTTEDSAVAWVILNRIKSSSFDNNPRDVVTETVPSIQFASITGGNSATTNARTPSTSTDRWRHSTYLACLMLTTTDTAEWSELVGNKINGQLYFYSYTSAKNSGNIFSGTTNNTLYIGSQKIKNVYVLGYGTVTSFPTLFSNYNPIAYSRNIYYDYD